MKVKNTPGITSSTPTRPVAAPAAQIDAAGRAYGRAAATGTALTPADDSVSIAGIPPEEFTPKVQAAISGLMGEVDTLRRDLEQARRRVRELEDLADLDTLLPIPNRRAFVRELNRMISFAERYGTPGSIIYIDMNGLKALNDTYGHEVGDAALKHLARMLKDSLRGTDMLARLGGDEFAVLLAHTDEDASAAKAHSLAEQVYASPIMVDGAPVHLTYAYGTYTFRGDDEAEAALDQADKAMYEQKRAFKAQQNGDTAALLDDSSGGLSDARAVDPDAL